MIPPETHVAHQLRDWSDSTEFHLAMRGDPAFAAAIRFVCRAGIPYSEFLGRVLVSGQPRWTDEDRLVAVAFERWSAAVCPSCGLHPLDWEHELDETWKGELRTCFGCRELGDVRSTIPEKHRDRGDIHAFLVPRSEQERMILEAVELGELPDEVLEDLT